MMLVPSVSVVKEKTSLQPAASSPTCNTNAECGVPGVSVVAWYSHTTPTHSVVVLRVRLQAGHDRVVDSAVGAQWAAVRPLLLRAACSVRQLERRLTP